MATQNPQRVEFGQAVKRARLAAEVTLKQVEERLHWYPGKASRVEAGTRVPVPAEVYQLADLFNLNSEDRAALHALADAARKREVSAHVADFAQSFLTYERAATQYDYWDAELIPAILQTKTYARALLATAGTDDLDAQVVDRVARRAVLTRDDPPTVRVLLGEAALRSQVGGPDGLREQLEHVLETATLPNVTIRVLPDTVGAHRAKGVGFTYLHLASSDVTRVYIDGITDATYIHEADETAVYSATFEGIWAQALDDEGSATILRVHIGTD
ncbi:MAG: helix-turn-helix transcriptional regulator [Actinophytocola sp.]|uniref:helix-turn-helix domain-containing protein n=1 Tax=Actinophytocola sp. TaxID=1872138 RepID=UPI003C725455